ncbi:hypothetical protein BQ8794_50021 [Mesorhizobium prunaredense]|uniref:Uncharacterized protein n=1 Tax=Mesorhizobium prunaredense TaxID=1631249 RepID=A0A1R3VDG2_9HYPH|nr:hypothetical protein BQ8794_50021 [Mesorhizobium prunaredense]
MIASENLTVTVPLNGVIVSAPGRLMGFAAKGCIRLLRWLPISWNVVSPVRVPTERGSLEPRHRGSRRQVKNLPRGIQIQGNVTAEEFVS